jgi:hypothetical protein
MSDPEDLTVQGAGKAADAAGWRGAGSRPDDEAPVRHDRAGRLGGRRSAGARHRGPGPPASVTARAEATAT